MLDVVQFVELDDGARVTSEPLGDMTLSVRASWTKDQLLADLREFIFEDELREVDEDSPTSRAGRTCASFSGNAARTPTTRRSPRCRSRSSWATTSRGASAGDTKTAPRRGRKG